jgi:alpha-ribazole phosphatase
VTDPATSFTLHLMRHGEPVGAGRLLGHDDAAPTPAGIAACVAQASGLAVEALHASDLARARCAGEAIAQAASLSLALDPRWRELDFGTWDGLAPAQVDKDALARFWADPNDHAPPGGERWDTLVQRVQTAIADLRPCPTLIITHAGAIRAALAALCGFDAHQAWALDLPYASLLSLRLWRSESDIPAGVNQISGQIIGLHT